MNTTYRLLWIDDDDDYIESTIELIEDTVKSNNMVPVIKTYSVYADYQKNELENFDIDVFNLYDQIIVDYALSGITGDQLIRELRAHNIFTDIVFYSSNFEAMQNEVKAGDQLDGVFFSRRENLTGVIDRVIKKNLKREYSISNIRGLIMDSTSEFDYICRTTTLALFDKLPSEKQAEVATKVKEYVGNAKAKSAGNFNKLDSLSEKKLVEASLSSVEYVMDNKDRYSIMSLVVREFIDNPLLNDDFSDKYQSNLIKPRNDLAHNKLFYGKCLKKLHIAKKRQRLECNQDCEHCTSKYSIEKCEELRKLIFSYYLLFSSINQSVDEILT